MSGTGSSGSAAPLVASSPTDWFSLWTVGGQLDGDRSVILAASISTAGIARNMQTPQPLGGGDLNGSSTTALMLGQAGTGSARGQVPRAGIKAGGGNYTGTV